MVRVWLMGINAGVVLFLLIKITNFAIRIQETDKWLKTH